VPYKPKVSVIDVDLKGGPIAFKDYAHSVKGLQDRFLAAAAWFKEYRKLDSVTLNHVYTCFKHMNWDVVPDMSDPFRKLESKDYGKYSKKAFAINHVGEDEAKKVTRVTTAA